MYLPLEKSKALSTNELWDRFYKYEKMACDVFARPEERTIYANLAHSVAVLLVGRMP